MARRDSRDGDTTRLSDGGPLVGRRFMRSLVRWRNRKAGLYYDGTPFTGKVRTRPPVPTVLSGSSVSSRGIAPLDEPVPAAQEFVMNSGTKPSSGPAPSKAPLKSKRDLKPCENFEKCQGTTKFGTLCRDCFREQGVHPCVECGATTPKRFARCKECFDASVARYKTLQVSA